MTAQAGTRGSRAGREQADVKARSVLFAVISLDDRLIGPVSRAFPLMISTAWLLRRSTQLRLMSPEMMEIRSASWALSTLPGRGGHPEPGGVAHRVDPHGGGDHGLGGNAIPKMGRATDDLVLDQSDLCA